MQKKVPFSVNTLCLSSKTEKKVNEGIINHFLANICKNFSYEGHLVEYRSVLSDSNFETNADICFEPVNHNDTWTLKIRKKKSFLKTLSHQ